MNYWNRYILAVMTVMATVTAHADDVKLEGQIMGTQPSINYASYSSTTTKNTRDCAFDGDASTFFAAYNSDMSWVGLDLGTPHVISRLGFLPRNNGSGATRMQLGVFEGANAEDFSDAVPLYLISDVPAKNEMTYVDVNVSRGFRYVRYVGPADSHCDIAELEFYGHEGEGTDSTFYQITCLPTVSIHVQDNAVPENKGQDFVSNVTIVYENGTLIQEYPITTRVRGNFSASHENKPYRIKFTDGKSHHMLKGSERDESPAKAKKWTLINNYGDKTLIRNNIAFEVSRRVGLAYTPYCRNVDLLLNGEYRGTYQLTDWVGIDENRVNITEMSATDTQDEALTGGYFIEMNGYAGSDPVNFTSTHGNPVTVHSPEDDVIQDVQFNYIRNHFNQMENLVYSSDYTDPENGYRKLLDLDSFLKYFLACEFSGNTDMLWQVFMYKERGDDHIYTGPVWDNDLALDNDGTVYPGNERADWTYTCRTAGRWSQLVGRVLSDPNAMARLQEIWGELRDQEIFTSQNIAAYVDSLQGLVNESQKLNFIRWPYLTQKVHCNPKVWGTWDDEVKCVRDYVYGRVDWMDNKLHYNQLEMADGAYQIGTSRDFQFFAKMVNNGQTDIQGALTADLDMSYSGDQFVPIGTTTNVYRGVFDGQNHTIRGLNLQGTRNVGLFGVVGNDAQISNLYVAGDCQFSGTRYVGALVGSVRGTTNTTLTNCGNAAHVMCNGSCVGGLVGGVTSSKLIMKNCYNVGPVEGDSQAGALVGNAFQAEVSDCFNTGFVTGGTEGQEFVGSSNLQLTNCYDTQFNQATRVTFDQMASGEVCYRLNEAAGNQAWRQNLDNGRTPDEYPVPIKSHGTVFLTDEGVYTNNNPNAKGYQYYKLTISKIQEGGTIQLSEFGILDSGYNEIPEFRVYKGTESNISNENWPNVADHDTGTKFCSAFNSPVTFLFDAGAEVNACGYRIYTANDTQSNPGRNPSSWTLYGSNTYTEDEDDASWVLLDEQTDDETLDATNYTPYDFYLTYTISDLTLALHESTLNPGDELLLEAAVTPSILAPQADLRWTSSDETVATVDATGLVKAVGVGTCTITVTSGFTPGMQATCQLTVTTQVQGYRYYLLAIDEMQGGDVIQMSEFDLLNGVGKEISGLKICYGTGGYFGDESWENLCDDKTSTKWCGRLSETAYCFFDAGSRVKPFAYRIYTANDTQSYPDRNPKTWRLYASNTYSEDPSDPNWVLLDEQTDNYDMEATNYTPYDFTITYQGTGIDMVRQTSDDKSIYDLQGRRVQQPRRGIYIQKGRKTFVR